jgi:hypothetical protein
VCKTANRATLIFPILRGEINEDRPSSERERDDHVPCSRGNPGNPVLRSKLDFLDRYFRQLTCFLVPLKGMRADRGHVDFTAKETREITEVGTLFDNRAGTGRDMSFFFLQKKNAVKG